MTKLLYLVFTLFVFNYGQVTHNGLAAYFPFNGNANDLSVNANAGTVNGPVSINDRFGRSNGAYYFDGVNDYISVKNSPSLSLKTAVSIAAWIKVYDHQDAHKVLVIKQSSYVLQRISSTYGKNKTANIASAVYVSGATNLGAEFKVTDLDTSKWNHVLAIYDGVKHSIYLNGVLKDSLSKTGVISTNTVDVMIGGMSSGYYSKVAMDDIYIFNKTLSQSEINLIYNDSGKAPTPAPPKLNELFSTISKKPALSWRSVSQVKNYTLQIASEVTFANPIVHDNVSDTIYTPKSDLPTGNIFWRVKSDGGENYSATSTFFVKDLLKAHVKYVPQEFKLLQTAIDSAKAGDTILCEDVADTSVIKITNKNLTVVGLNETNKVELKNQILVNNSILNLKNLKITGKAGISGPVDYAANPYDYCPAKPSAGGAGGDAVQIINSTATLVKVDVYGGNGGSGSRCADCDGIGDRCFFTAPQGAGGMGGIGIYTNNSTVSLQNSIFRGGSGGVPYGLGGRFINMSILNAYSVTYDSMYIDGTSKFLISGSSIIPLEKSVHVSPLTIYSENGFLFIELNTPKNGGQLTIYSMNGQELKKINIISGRQVMWSPAAGSGHYLIEFEDNVKSYLQKVSISQ